MQFEETATIDPVQPTDRAAPGEKRVLFVSYVFPPVGGAGVQRVTKFVKYLRRQQWLSSVLTAANPSVPLFDHSLLDDVPTNTKIVRAPSWEPGYRLKTAGVDHCGPAPQGGIVKGALRLARWMAAGILQPDPQILWFPSALRAGTRLLRTVKHDAIVTTAPPFSGFLLGAALAHRCQLPLILDYRDEWTLSNKYWENKQLGAASRSIQSWLERRVLRGAKGVLATTRSSAESLEELCRQAGASARVGWIYNGFDADDFPKSDSAEAKGDRFRLVYMGTLWNLTSAGPLVDAVTRLSAGHPELAARLEFVFVGRNTGTQLAHLEALRRLPCQVVTHDYLDHTAALGVLSSADAVCLLLSDVPGAERVVPAKLFEYMASRRPILAMLPRGETWDLLDGYRGAHRFMPGDTDGIARWLAQAAQQGSLVAEIHDDSEDYLCQFNREYQAAQLAGFLNACCGAEEGAAVRCSPAWQAPAGASDHEAIAQPRAVAAKPSQRDRPVRNDAA